MRRAAAGFLLLGGAQAASARMQEAAPAAPLPPASPDDPVERLSRNLRLLADNPHSLQALTGAGRAALDVGDPSAAIGFFARAQEAAPKDGRVKAGLAAALVQLEQPKDALRYFDQAKALGVPEAELAADRGLAYDLRGDGRRAQADYRLALTHGGASDETTRRLALSLAMAGDRAGALATLEPLLRRQDRGAWRASTFVLAITGDSAGADARVAQLMTPAQAQAMRPFLDRLAALKPAEQAAAVHFGHFPSTGQGTGARLAAAPRPAADRPLLPSGMALAPLAAASDEAPAIVPPSPAPAGSSLADAFMRPSDPAARATRRRPGLTDEPVRSRTEPAAVSGVEAQAAPALARQASAAGGTRAPAAVRRAPVAMASIAGEGGVAMPRDVPATRQAPRATAVAIVPGGMSTSPAVARAVPSTAIPAAPIPGPPKPADDTGRDTIALAPPGSIAGGAATARIVTAEPRAMPAAPATVVAADAVPAAADTRAQATDAPPPPIASASASDTRSAPAEPGASRVATLAAGPTPTSGDAAAQAEASAPAARPSYGPPVSLAAASPGYTTMPAETPAMPPPPAASAPSAPASIADVAVSPPAAPIALAAVPASRERAAPVWAPDSVPPPRAAGREARARDTKRVSEADAAGPAVHARGAQAAADAEATSPDTAPTASERAAAAKAAKLAEAKVAKDAKAAKAAKAQAASDAKAAREAKAQAAEDAKAAKAAKAKAAEEKRQARAAPERYWVQVAGGANKNDLPKAWERARAAHSQDLAGRTPHTTPLRFTNRLLIGPFKSADEAQAFVNRTGKAGWQTFPFTSPAGQKVESLPAK